MKMNRNTLFLTAAATAILGLAACNNNEPAATTPAEPTSTTTAPATTAPAAASTMTPTDNIVVNATKSANLTTLVSAIQAAGLTQTLEGAGPFTVFAPDNAAFEKVPAATRESLMQPAQRADLTKILTYHVVPGRLTAADIAAQAQAHNGVATLKTVQGETLTVRDAGGGRWTITDGKGGSSIITQADNAQSNGVIHVIDTVLMPK